MFKILKKFENTQLKNNFPKFMVGDTVMVTIILIDKFRKKYQKFDGVVISKKNKGINSSFMIRKILNNEGVEKTFQLHSPAIKKIQVKKKGNVRKAKLYYTRSFFKKKYPHIK